MIKIELINGIFTTEKNSFQSLNSKGFGTKNENKYEFDIYEILYLIEKNKITVLQKNKELKFDDIIRKKKVSQTNYIVYKDLRTKGYYVKSGLKYGFAFRVYDKGIKIGEDHSLWLVEPIKENKKLSIHFFTGKNRIAHSTKKKMLLAIVDNENSVTYLETSWKRT